jgi:hypothetical protein
MREHKSSLGSIATRIVPRNGTMMKDQRIFFLYLIITVMLLYVQTI